MHVLVSVASAVFDVHHVCVLQVLQRGLPRPVSLTYGPEVKAGADSHSMKEAAELLLFREMLSLLEHDAAKYPIKESKKDKRVGLDCPCVQIVGCWEGCGGGWPPACAH